MPIMSPIRSCPSTPNIICRRNIFRVLLQRPPHVSSINPEYNDARGHTIYFSFAILLVRSTVERLENVCSARIIRTPFLDHQNIHNQDSHGAQGHFALYTHT